MVFQNYALFPHMSVRQERRLRPDDARRRRAPRSQRRVEEALGLVRLKGQEGKLPGQLSGGQQQRVAIARAIVVEPPLVLMDEPLSNLDAKLRLEMRAEIRRIHNTLGATTIYVTHDQEEALSLADRIVVLRDGEVRQVGTPEDLFARPDHLDVAEFMGFRNRLTGHAGAIVNGDVPSSSRRARASTGIVSDRRAAGRAAPSPSAAGRSPSRCAGRALRRRSRRRNSAAATSSASRAPPAGAELVFRSERRVEAGETVSLGADPDRVLIYAGRLSMSDAATHRPPHRAAQRRDGGVDPAHAAPRGARARRPDAAGRCRRSLFSRALFVYPFLYGLWLSFQPKAGAAARELQRASSPIRSSTTRSPRRCGSLCP